ncbi:hypothetical protein INT47_003925 [Mucor saturninus]|uniref:PH domain-containing protein n=1 Tax=Mucor saturninus TaxID=64648 RepID=A0A8H7QLV1_9FUNG|nr:hypothetical protein INT47_003925 [Mucor saturninus]
MTISPMSMPFPVDEVRVRQSVFPTDIEDPMTFRPRACGIAVDLILQQANLTGWLTKHRPPTFSFLKNIKRRYVVLVDRLLYSFKSTQPDTYREFFELTANTNAYVTDQVTGVLFCIEIKKKGHEDSWFLQADNAEDMKMWLDRIKRTISCLRTPGLTGTITSQKLAEIMTECEEYSTIAGNHRSSSTSSISDLSVAFPMPPCSPISSIHDSINRKSSQRSYSISSNLPPQLPPPTSLPPPIPSYAYI